MGQIEHHQSIRKKKSLVLNFLLCFKDDNDCTFSEITNQSSYVSGFNRCSEHRVAGHTCIRMLAYEPHLCEGRLRSKVYKKPNKFIISFTTVTISSGVYKEMDRTCPFTYSWMQMIDSGNSKVEAWHMMCIEETDSTGCVVDVCDLLPSLSQDAMWKWL